MSNEVKNRAFGQDLTGGIAIYGDNKKSNGFRRTRSDEEIALERKLIRPAGMQRSPQAQNANGNPYPTGNLAGAIINDTARNIVDGRNLTQLCPDIKIARLLLVSSIISPNDLVTTKLTYINEAMNFGNLKSPLLEIIEKCFESIHNIDQDLPVWLDKILFEDGSKTLIVLPDSQLDDIINSDLRSREGRLAVESYVNDVSENGVFSSTGILGTPRKEDPEYRTNIKSVMNSIRTLATESGKVTLDKCYHTPERTVDFSIGDTKTTFKYSINDNRDILKVGKLSLKLAQEKARSLALAEVPAYHDDLSLMLATESGYVGNIDFGSEGEYGFARERDNTWKIVTSVENPTFKSTAEPTIIEPPAECIIPAYLFGNVREHIGYYFAIDQTGNFLSVADSTDYYRDVVSSKQPGQNAAGQMIDQVTQATYGSQQYNPTANLREEQQMLSAAIISKQLKTSMEMGVYRGVKLALGNVDGVSKLMLAHALAGDHAQFLYIPKDLVTYLAFDYNDYGVGESLLAQNKMQGAIRTMLQFTNTQAAVNNAVLHTKINITLDEFETDANRTIEQIYHEVVRRRIASYPLGISSPLDQLEFLAAAATSINVENHPGYPGTKVDMDFFNNTQSLIDNELMENVKKEFFLGLGLPPETIDQSIGVEFAQSIITSNILLAKRAMIYQQKLCAGVTTHLKRYLMASENSKNEMIDCILSNVDVFKDKDFYSILEKKDAKARDVAYKLVLLFISQTSVSLPAPDIKTLEMQLEALESKVKYYDEVLKHFITEDLVQDWNVGTETADKVQYCIALFKSHLVRQYIQEQNIAPELFSALGYDKDSEAIIPIFEQQAEMNKRLGRAFAGHIKESQKEAANIENIATAAGTLEEVDAMASDMTNTGDQIGDGAETGNAGDPFAQVDDGAGAFGGGSDFTSEPDADASSGDQEDQ